MHPYVLKSSTLRTGMAVNLNHIHVGLLPTEISAPSEHVKSYP